MCWPSGTSIYDVADPSKPRLIARIDLPEGWHSHKVRVADGIMIVNHEKLGQRRAADSAAGSPFTTFAPERAEADPKWRTRAAAYTATISMAATPISRRPAKAMLAISWRSSTLPIRPPRRGRRWWIEGQYQAGGEAYPWSRELPTPRCHHPLRLGDRLYVSYWHHGFFILDISDLSRPTLVSQLNSSPSFPHPTHTCLPIPQP